MGMTWNKFQFIIVLVAIFYVHLVCAEWVGDRSKITCTYFNIIRINYNFFQLLLLAENFIIIWITQSINQLPLITIIYPPRYCISLFLLCSLYYSVIVDNINGEKRAVIVLLLIALTLNAYELYGSKMKRAMNFYWRWFLRKILK